jgi:hypothetical protein
MKTLIVMAVSFVCLLVSTAVRAEEPGRMLFPKDSVGGYIEYEFSPSTNERDLNRCPPNAGQIAGPNTPCAAFSKWALSGYFEMQPFGQKLGPIKNVFFFVEPHTYFGRNLPQVRYTLSMDPILLERSIGVGFKLPKDFELRLWQHRNYWLGHYGQYLGSVDLGRNGPYGLYSALSVRWYYGTWRHH